ncbi:MAG TPA: hypothetical protein VMT23_01685 [Candidatus Binatia bacterium]|nr:hypothetical protein [Candidatus Binatia bacterium]
MSSTMDEHPEQRPLVVVNIYSGAEPTVAATPVTGSLTRRLSESPTTPPPVAPSAPSGNSGGHIHIDNLFDDFLRVVAIIAAIVAVVALALFGARAIQWAWDYTFGSDAKSTPTTITVPALLNSERFLTVGHSVCGAAYVNNGSAIRLMLKRRATCGHTVSAVLPVERVQITHAASILRNNATLVYHGTELNPAGDQFQNILHMPLGNQLKQDLKLVNLRLTPQGYKLLQASSG